MAGDLPARSQSLKVQRLADFLQNIAVILNDLSSIHKISSKLNTKLNIKLSSRNT